LVLPNSFIQSLPVQMTDFSPRLPHPLLTRVRSGQIVIGLIDDPMAPMIDLREALGQEANLPLRLVLIGSTAPDLYADDGNRAVEHFKDADPHLASVLPQLEVFCAPAHRLAPYHRLLTQLAVPTLALLDHGPTPAHWDGPGLAVAAANAEEIARLLLLLATDPPTRRRALASQRAGFHIPADSRWRVEGVFDSSYSLAIVNRLFALALDETAGADESIALFTFEQGDTPEPNFSCCEQPQRVRTLWERSQDPLAPGVALRDAWPPVVRDMRAHHRVLANYGWEETGFPSQYAQDFNRVLDLITVLSSQTARMLQDAGTEVPIAVVGAGIDHLLDIQPEPPPLELPPGFRLLHISSCLPRKGIDVLLEAYGQAFRDRHDVSLIIKTYPNPHNDVAEQLERWRQGDPQYPHVLLCQDDWTQAQIAGLYQACHVLVAPSRGEGFGLPIAEAMLHRLPVVVTAWGGHMDFCDASRCWLIDYHLAPAGTHLSTPGSLWAEPSVEHLSSQLRTLYMERAQLPQDKLERARQYVRARYTWRQIAQRNRDALRQIQAQPGPLPTPRLGWISTWGSRCGIAAYSAHLSGALPADALKVLAPDDEQPEQADAPFVHRCWSLDATGQASVTRLLDAIEPLQLEACVIQHHWAWFDLDPLCALIEALHERGITMVLDLHNTRSAPAVIAHPRYQRILARCARILVHSLADMTRMHHWGLDQNATLFPLAVYAVPQTQATTEHSCGSGSLLATFGYLMPHKGLAEMVQAMPAILQQHPEARLLMLNALYNEAVSAPEHERLRVLIDQLGLDAHVQLETRYLPEDECVARLSQADLIVFPYQNTEESSSAAVRMAIAAGRPIAVTPLTFFDDVASATQRLPGCAPAEIAAGVITLLDAFGDPQERAAAASRAREFAAAHDSRALAERLRGLLFGILRQLPPLIDA
jgi:glycosyltransferase involved in cell wall biosynthesis